MKVPPDYLLREGDLVTIRATVRYTTEPVDEDVHLKVVGSSSHVRIPVKEVVSLEGRFWDLEDRVVFKGAPSEPGEVVATSGDKVWVKIDRTGDYVTADSIDLEPVPPQPAKDD